MPKLPLALKTHKVSIEKIFLMKRGFDLVKIDFELDLVEFGRFGDLISSLWHYRYQTEFPSWKSVSIISELDSDRYWFWSHI